MSAGKFSVLIVMVIVISVGLMSVFTVKQTERAIKLLFGKVVSTDYSAGLHFKVPFAHQIRKFDARIQTLNAQPEQFLTAEKKNVIVDSYVKWKIKDLLSYYTAVGGNVQRAGDRLAEIIADGLRSEFGKRTIQEVVSGDRSKIMELITTEARSRANEFGIEIVDVRIRRIELPKEVSTSVYRRMEAERERVAKELRSRGEAAALRIQAEADRSRIEVIAQAEREAEIIRGKGDAQSTAIYAQAFNKNPEFFRFYRSLNAYKKVFKTGKDILVLQPNSDFFQYFKDSEHNMGMNKPHIPKSPQSLAPDLEASQPALPQPALNPPIPGGETRENTSTEPSPVAE